VYFTNHYSKKELNETKKKSNICIELGVELLIEDSLDYAFECSSEKIKVLLLDKPWNKADKLPAGVTRVHSWREIIEKINGKIY